MERRFREVIELLDYNELLRVKNDLNKGGDSIRILVDNRIKDEIKKKNEFCTVCAAKIEQESNAKIKLTLGSKEMEREVSFCAIDCMEYFLGGLKKAKGQKEKE